MGMVGHVLPLLGLKHLLVLDLHVAAELARADEPLVDSSSLAGGTDVPLLLGLDHHLPSVDGNLVDPETCLEGNQFGSKVCSEDPFLAGNISVLLNDKPWCPVVAMARLDHQGRGPERAHQLNLWTLN